jgi:RNA polymerase subunit RPABC4/transcription elongation factor Spt4
LRGDPWRIERVALYLQEAGLSSCVDSYPPGRRLGSGGLLSFGGDSQVGIYVHPDEREQGMRLIEEYDAGRMPEPEPAESEAEGCPACGGELVPDGSSCSSCGLEFPVERFECVNCRAAVPDDATTCPECGVTIDHASLHAEGRENHGE